MRPGGYERAQERHAYLLGVRDLTTLLLSHDGDAELLRRVLPLLGIEARGMLSTLGVIERAIEQVERELPIPLRRP